MSYAAFLERKSQAADMGGFTPTVMPSWLFDFQASLVEWAVRKGRAALFTDCGSGKSPMQLVWAQNVIERTNKPVLILTPLAVGAQTKREAEKFSIQATRSTGVVPTSAQVVITNYEQLHHFTPSDFAGVVCDESSILKNYDGVTKAAVTEFMRTLPYRLLCTATAAPNDYIELGTSAEALGEMGFTDMLGVFFKNDESSLAPLSHESKWRFKPHAEQPFWRWLCTWARAMRRPSDLGFSDGPFVLPALRETVVTVAASRPMEGFLFVMPARDLQEQRAERRLTIQERCERVAEIAIAESGPFIAWCHLNDEAARLKSMLPNCVEVSGSDSDEAKEEKFDAFTMGQIDQLVTKPKIAAFGLNWQHCRRMSLFPSHSYEQYYQAVRRCWRFGQTDAVDVYLITTEGESDVLGNLQRKSAAADLMFASLVREMSHASTVARPARPVVTNAPLPSWLQGVTA